MTVLISSPLKLVCKHCIQVKEVTETLRCQVLGLGLASNYYSGFAGGDCVSVCWILENRPLCHFDIIFICLIPLWNFLLNQSDNLNYCLNIGSILYVDVSWDCKCSNMEILISRVTIWSVFQNPVTNQGSGVTM